MFLEKIHTVVPLQYAAFPRVEAILDTESLRCPQRGERVLLMWIDHVSDRFLALSTARTGIFPPEKFVYEIRKGFPNTSEFAKHTPFARSVI